MSQRAGALLTAADTRSAAGARPTGGLGMALYFASQGAGRLLWPLLANLTRLVIAAGGGWLAVRSSGDLSHVFFALSAALAAFGLINAGAAARGPGSARSAGRGWFGRESTCPTTHERGST